MVGYWLSHKLCILEKEGCHKYLILNHQTRVSYDETRNEVFTSLYIHNDNIVIKAKVDTGAQTNVLPYNIFVTLKNTPKVYHPP